MITDEMHISTIKRFFDNKTKESREVKDTIVAQVMEETILEEIRQEIRRTLCDIPLPALMKRYDILKKGQWKKSTSQNKGKPKTTKKVTKKKVTKGN